MWQNIIVISIALACVLYAVVSLVKILRRKKNGSCGCTGCSGCTHCHACAQQVFSEEEDSLKSENPEA